ncbi:Aminoacyl-transfer RNA synthetases class-II family profile domain-containing protein [Plasmodiophora brassicae]
MRVPCRAFLRRCLSTAAKWIGPDRTAYCSDIASMPVGTPVRVCGFLHAVRPLGHMLFVVVEDGRGRVQGVWSKDRARGGPDQFASVAGALRVHQVCVVDGTVKQNRPGDRNEIAMDDVRVISDVGVDRWSLPDDASKGDVALRYRYLALRRPELHQVLHLRSKASRVIRDFLDDNSFTEVETPVLLPSSPEGAREFLVPTRYPKEYYALAQSPQIFKQLLMVGGFDRYFQFARCFRDEDGRADRQVEFTQIDAEMAFVGSDEVMNATEAMLCHLATALPETRLGLPPGPFPRYTYDEVMKRYGTDKPDLRFGMEIQDLGDGWFGFLSPGLSQVPAEQWSHGECCKAVPVSEAGQGVLSHFPDSKPDDCLVLSRNLKGIGLSRVSIASLLHSHGLLEYTDPQWLWVTNMPMFEVCEEDPDRLQCCHHPFTAPVERGAFLSANTRDELLALRSQSYDLVVNGIELGGGSIRIHREDDQRRVLCSILQRPADQYAALLDGLRHGAPPHGGIAIGFDRLVSLFGTPNHPRAIRDVIAFPKTAGGRDLMMGAPARLHSSPPRPPVHAERVNA